MGQKCCKNQQKIGLSGVQDGRILASRGYNEHKRTPQKGIKNGTRKLLKKVRFWDHFWGPKSGTKVNKKYSKSDLLPRELPGVSQQAQESSKRGPRESQERPREAQKAPSDAKKSAKRDPQSAQEDPKEPSWCQNNTTGTPKCREAP